MPCSRRHQSPDPRRCPGGNDLRPRGLARRADDPRWRRAHYLIITQSLLIDHALTIDDVHRRGDYRACFPTELQPHVQMRGRNGRIYSVHARGLPALVAPAFVVGGYHGVVGFLILIGAAGSALAWHVGWLATRRADAAWLAGRRSLFL